MNPDARVVEIGPSDVAGQAAFCDYVPQVFRTVDFRRWRDWGQWTSDYRAFAVMEEDRVVANSSVMRMRLLLEGRETVGYQLGAVGCLPSHRGRGLARAALEAALDHCGASPVLLFGNPRVRDFYPRFGFVPRAQMQFGVELRVEPQGPPAPRMALADPQVREDLRALSRDGLPVTERFGAREYPAIATWYAANGFARPLRRLELGGGHTAWVFAGVEDGTLYVDDILAREVFDLRPHLSRLIEAPVTSVRFGFTPERWWPETRVLGEDVEADLFVRQLVPSTEPHCFPVLAKT